MKQLLVILVSFGICLASYAYNPFWTYKDKRMIMGLVKTDKNNAREVERYFRRKMPAVVKTNLGFGWTLWDASTAGWRVSIAARFYYYHDTLVSYALDTRLPEEKALQARYRKWGEHYFSYTDSGKQSLAFNEMALLKPLPEYTGTSVNISPAVLHYMSPGSDIAYGYRGSIALFPNRQSFNRIKDSLTNADLMLMLYSINPASRLTTIEYCISHKSRFNEQQWQALTPWIDSVVKEIPEVKTVYGCDEFTFSTWFAIQFYAGLQEK